MVSKELHFGTRPTLHNEKADNLVYNHYMTSGWRAPDAGFKAQGPALPRASSRTSSALPAAIEVLK